VPYDVRPGDTQLTLHPFQGQVVAKVVNLKQYRRRKTELRSYGAWEKRFGEVFAEGTHLGDLSDRVVSYLATPGEAGNTAFYELIMGTLGYGAAAGFYYLDNEAQMRVVDIHLFLADQVRFEMMRRIGWISALAAGEFPLIELIGNFDRIRQPVRTQPPELAPTHPAYEKCRRLSVREREVFIRQLLPSALDAFVKREK
jgi:hypothetical protein